MTAVRNMTRDIVICRNAETVRTAFQKARGLMFRSRLATGTGMLFAQEQERRTDIWTVGMRFPIDIVWVSSDGRIVKMKQNARPWRYATRGATALWVLELPAGTLRKTKTAEGDILAIGS